MLDRTDETEGEALFLQPARRVMTRHDDYADDLQVCMHSVMVVASIR